MCMCMCIFIFMCEKCLNASACAIKYVSACAYVLKHVSASACVIKYVSACVTDKVWRRLRVFRECSLWVLKVILVWISSNLIS